MGIHPEPITIVIVDVIKSSSGYSVSLCVNIFFYLVFLVLAIVTFANTPKA